MRTNQATSSTRDVRGGVGGALPLIAELHEVAVDAGDELRVLAGEGLRIPSPALHDVVAPGAERRAPVDDQIAGFASGPPECDPAGFRGYSKIAVLDPRATSRTSLLSQFDTSIIRIFRPFSSCVPTNGLSCHAQPCASKCLVDAGLAQLEARVGEAVLLVDAGLRAAQIARAARSFLSARSTSARRSIPAPTPAGCRRPRCALRGPTSRAIRCPAASRTDTQGCEPVSCSSRKWNGGAGAPFDPHGPASRSSAEIDPGSRHNHLPARP